MGAELSGVNQMVRLSPEHAEQLALTATSEESLARVWENDRDAAYDNWRELYGVPAG